MQSISGKTALVVGGSGGIGAAISKKLARCGTSLIIHGGHDSCAFTKLIDELDTLVSVKKVIHPFTADCVTDFSQTPFSSLLSEVDILCVCFGPFLQKDLHSMTNTDWKNIVTLDFALPGILLSFALPFMIQKNWGRFLLLGGTRTERVNAFATNAAYGAAKTAIASLIRSTALSYAPHNITCNGIFPGFTETEYLSDIQRVELAQKMPQKRLIQVDEIAETAVHILKQPMVNGALISMDGGWDPSFE